MSKLTELLDELCPDGVEYRPFSEVIERLRTGLNPRKNFILNSPGSKNYYITVRELGGFNIETTEKTDLVNDAGLQLIQNRSGLRTGDVLFSGTGTIGRTALVSTEPKDWNIKEGVYALTPDHSILDSRFLVYALNSSRFQNAVHARAAGGTVKSISMKNLSALTLPVPPLEVQQEIARVLDAFTDLEQSLVWELELRKKQYGFHRDELLSFTANGGELCSDRVEYRLLSELGKRNKGMVITASRMKELHQEGGEVRIFAGGYTVADVDRDDLPDGAVIDKPSIIVKSRGNIGFEYHTKPFTHKNELWSYTLDDPDVDQKFIFYYLQSRVDYFQLKAKSGKLPQIGVRDTDHFSVPTPPLDVQKKIVAKLDTFQALIDSIKQEITLRRTQYEFHRDELLSFASKED